LTASRVGAKATVQIARLDRAARQGQSTRRYRKRQRDGAMMVPVAISGSIVDRVIGMALLVLQEKLRRGAHPVWPTPTMIGLIRA
jgi:hypothetical protein